MFYLILGPNFFGIVISVCISIGKNQSVPQYGRGKSKFAPVFN